ncbi:GNAT family N-acetyltransferase [Saccharibacillus sp. JS10]|uniref:GNAT family N-acetyltransferase n=1 Tax=Saccharibacillus sp. JS10 TaxID=2950552 RepID=UPI0021089D5F|nr:GNAT family N-acetyltransferase [Saccharibacillus sp. JS10]MCQ4088500.1 GNAT family N-acetyltransferase [Saccharibacillus sp. JS10]
MNVELIPCGSDQSYIVHNMYPLYLHDLSEIWQNRPNAFGIFEEDDTPTLARQSEIFEVWWQHPGILFPLLIRVDGRPAGFAFVATPPYAPSETDYYLNEFFVLRPYRASGVAEAAARKVFDSFQGRWELQTNPSERNLRAQKFWRRTLSAYTSGNFTEKKGNHHEVEMLAFRFNRKPKCDPT